MRLHCSTVTRKSGELVVRILAKNKEINGPLLRLIVNYYVVRKFGVCDEVLGDVPDELVALLIHVPIGDVITESFIRLW